MKECQYARAPSLRVGFYKDLKYAPRSFFQPSSLVKTGQGWDHFCNPFGLWQSCLLDALTSCILLQDLVPRVGPSLCHAHSPVAPCACISQDFAAAAEIPVGQSGLSHTSENEDERSHCDPLGSRGHGWPIPWKILRVQEFTPVPGWPETLVQEEAKAVIFIARCTSALFCWTSLGLRFYLWECSSTCWSCTGEMRWKGVVEKHQWFRAMDY